MKTELFGRNDIEAAAAVLRRGGLVAVPTETVYGLCGAALDERAVREIYEVRGRPEVKPLSLMVHSPAELDRWCRDVPPQARLLAAVLQPTPIRAPNNKTLRKGLSSKGLCWVWPIFSINTCN